MKIKNKVIVSNIVIVVIPILTLLIIMGISIKSNNYHETIEEIIETLVKDKNSLYSVQSLIYQYEDDIFSIPKSSYKNTTQKELESNQLSNLNQELSKLGYNLSIEVNNKNLYDNLTKQEHQKLNELIKNYDNNFKHTVITLDF